MGTPYRECPNCGAHLDAGERYFALVSGRWERFGDVIAGILKRRSVTRADVDNIGGIVEL